MEMDLGCNLGEAVGDRIIVGVDVDVIVDADTAHPPLAVFVGLSRQVLERWAIDLLAPLAPIAPLGLPKARPDQANGGAPPIRERPRAGSFRGRDHLGIGGRHHSELGGGFLKNQQLNGLKGDDDNGKIR
jgi:hypothetical protein